MAPSVKATNKAALNSATSIIIPTPGGISVGDLLWGAVIADNLGSWSTPALWTQFHHAAVITDYVLAIYFKIADAADVVASNFTWTWTGGASKLVGMMACIAQGEEIEGEQNTVANSGGTSLLCPSYTTVKANSLILRLLAMEWQTTDATSLSAPGGVTFQDRVDGLFNADPQMFLYVDDAIIISPGATGSKTFTAVGSVGTNQGRYMTMGIPALAVGSGGGMGMVLDESGEAITKGQKILNPFGTKKRACMCPVGKCRCL